MKALLHSLALCGSLLAATAAYAYSLTCKGDACTVTCDNGQPAGTMYWNGSVWSDGIRSNKDKDELAKQIVRAQGTACR